MSVLLICTRIVGSVEILRYKLVFPTNILIPITAKQAEELMLKGGYTYSVIPTENIIVYSTVPI